MTNQNIKVANMLSQKFKHKLCELLMRECEASEEEALAFINARDMELRKQEIADKLDNELVTKDFLKSEIARLDNKIDRLDNKIDKLRYLVYLVLVLTSIFNPTLVEALRHLLNLAR